MHKLKPVVFYCGDPLDHYVFLPVMQHMGDVPYVSDKKEVRTFLSTLGKSCLSLPVFPQAVIMARHSNHKFPCAKIVSIGLRHGAYHFKRMTSASNYNQFDLYLMTSRSDVQVGKEHGIYTAKAVGFPKLDPAFNNSITAAFLEQLSNNLGIDKNKPTVLFSSTYNTSGMSAIHLWYSRLANLTDKWNVLVTLHPWIKTIYKDTIKSTPGVVFIDDYFNLPHIQLADVVVGDTSSFLAECCALDKPIITFQTPTARRSLGEIEEIISSISYRVKTFDALMQKLSYALEHKSELAAARIKANQIFFDKLDGKAGERAAYAIKQLLEGSE